MSVLRRARRRVGVVVCGLQWGDEAKGKFVDFLAALAILCGRGQGGANAGHTILTALGKLISHAIPSSITWPHTMNFLGPGMVISPPGVVKELEEITKLGVDYSGRLAISSQLHLVTLVHTLLDKLEEQRRGGQAIGSTLQGIGPAYMDMVGRRGLQAHLLLDLPRLRSEIERMLVFANDIIVNVYHHEPVSVEDVYRPLAEAAEALAPLVGSTHDLIANAIAVGDRVLIEGQLGAHRDLVHGSYPWVTTSWVLPSGIAYGAGLPITAVNAVLGVCKAYTTAVGNGPFTTRMEPDVEEWFQRQGGEYGATTGRRRGCGWFSVPETKWALEATGATHIAMAKLDVLTGAPELKVCVAVENGVPVYQEFETWDTPIGDARSRRDLPNAADEYVEAIEEMLGVPIVLLGVGAHRDATFWRHGEIDLWQ